MAFIPPLIAAAGSALGGVGGLGAILGGAGAIFQGISANRAAGYQARVAEMNAKISAQNAERATQRSQVEQQMQDRETAAMLGEQRAAMAGSGLDLDSSSFIRTRTTAAELGRMDALNVRQAGDIEAFNFRVDASSQRANANLARMEGRNALVSSFFKAGKSLIGDATSTKSPNRITGVSRRTGDDWYGLRRTTI